MNKINVHPDREVREFPIKELRIETNAAGGKVLKGYSAVFDELSNDLGGFRERISPGAFANTILKDDVKALFNHNPDNVLGRNKSNTLRLTEDSKGLFMEVDLPETPVAQGLAVSIERGDITGQSFAFKVNPGGQQFSEDEDGNAIRTLTDLTLFDVGPVVFPAYPQTDVALRSLENAGFMKDAADGVLNLPESDAFSRMKKIRDAITSKENAGKDWVEIRDNGDNTDVEILLYDTIGLYGTDPKDFVRTLNGFKGRNLHIRINSPGGSVFDGAAIYNALRRHDGVVTIDIDGLAASMAGIIAMAGHKVRMNQNAFFMMHNASGCVLGDANQMESEAVLLRKINGSLAKTLATRSNQEHKEVIKLMDKETWLTAEEAKEMGFVDEILNDQAAIVRSHDLSHYRNVPANLKEVRVRQKSLNDKIAVEQEQMKLRNQHMEFVADL